ncbi:MAG: DUF4274 domain-containing protein [Bacteroidota bacterium]
MIILPSKERLIEKHFLEYSFSDDDTKPNFDVFKKLNSFDQYYLASIFNWDDGIEVLNWIIDSPKCDSGTACMIFWQAEPDYYADHTIDTIDEINKDVFELLQKIVERFKTNGFKWNLLKFDLLDNGYDTTTISSKHDIWELPEKLKNGTKGFVPISLNGIRGMIWMYQRNRRLKKREKRKAARQKKLHNNQ